MRGRRPVTPILVPFRWDRIVVSKVGDQLITVVPDVARQQLSNPHVAPGGSVLLAYGTEDADPQLIGDRIYSILKVGPGAMDGLTTAMAYAPHPPQVIDYLGAGAAIARAPGGLAALLSVTNAAEKKEWMTTAMNDATDGGRWTFPNLNQSALVTDPLLSQPVIYRADLSGVQPDGSFRFWHVAMCWIDGAYEVCIGYAGEAGLCATWWRIVDGQVWRLRGGDPFDGERVPSSVIPDDDSWTVAAQWPGDAADPSEIVQVNGQGVFFYHPIDGVFDCPTKIRYARMTKGAESKELDTSPVWEKWSPGIAGISPAGNSLTCWQSGPTTLSGYIGACPKPPPANGRMGLVEIELELVT